jgi:hypothetical protein
MLAQLISKKVRVKSMTNEPKPLPPEDPSEAEPGRGAPGDNHSGVQTAQTTAVNAPDAVIPANTNPEQDRQQLEAFAKQEDPTGLHTTDGYVTDEAGRLNNFAVEPPMYVEGE